jgi:hypothetical protein
MLCVACFGAATCQTWPSLLFFRTSEISIYLREYHTIVYFRCVQIVLILPCFCNFIILYISALLARFTLV